MTITFTIPGKPFAKQRPRMGRFTTYTPKATVSFEDTVRQLAALHLVEPFTGPVRVDVLATFKPAKSWSKKKTAEHIGRYHVQKPDGDNLIKAVLDGMNRVAYVDDSQVSEQFVRKVWGPDERTVVVITPLSSDDILREAAG